MIGLVDVGGTKIALAVADQAGVILARDRFDTRPERGPRAVLAELVDRLRALNRTGPFTLMGVASAGPLDLETGVLLSPPNFPAGWESVPLKFHLEEAFGARVSIDNDANAAALGEYRFGAARGAKSVLYLTISTGIGGGVVLDGKVVHARGELGHQILLRDGPLCGCGARGCLEALASGSAIAKQAREGAHSGRSPALAILAAGRPETLNASHVVAAARAGDAFSISLWQETIHWLAVGIGNAITILAPDCVVLGGGVTATGDALLAPLKASIARQVKLVSLDRMTLKLAQSPHDAGIQGALALALDGR